MAIGSGLLKLPRSTGDNALKQFNRHKKDVEISAKIASLRDRVLQAFNNVE